MYMRTEVFLAVSCCMMGKDQCACTVFYVLQRTRVLRARREIIVSEGRERVLRARCEIIVSEG